MEKYKYFYLITYLGSNNSTGVMELYRNKKIETHSQYEEVRDYLSKQLKEKYNIDNHIISNIVKLRNK